MAVAVGGEELTFAQLDERSDRAVGWLIRHTRPGDRVVMWTSTCVDAAVLFAATSKAGVAFCPLNQAATEAEVDEALAVVEPTVIVTAKNRYATAVRSGPRFEAAVVDWESLAEHDPGSESPVTAPEFSDRAPQLMVFTSGTTGAPKAAMVSHRTQFLRTHLGAQFEPRGRSVCVFPLFHVAPWLIALQQWHARDGVVFTTDTNPDTIATAVADHWGYPPQHDPGIVATDVRVSRRCRSCGQPVGNLALCRYWHICHSALAIAGDSKSRC